MNFGQQKAALAGIRVLVIEDALENMRLFRAILRLEGAVMLEAFRGVEGIEIAKRELPEVILIDMQMPEMDGLTATRLLRSDPQTAAIPIVIVTASAMREDRARAFEAGCSGYITKPVDPLTLGQQIAAFLPSRDFSSQPQSFTSQEAPL